MRVADAMAALTGPRQRAVPGFSNGVGVDDDEIRTGNSMILDPYGRIPGRDMEDGGRHGRGGSRSVASPSLHLAKVDPDAKARVVSASAPGRKEIPDRSASVARSRRPASVRVPVPVARQAACFRLWGA